MGLGSILTATQWHEAEAAYSTAAESLRTAYDALRSIDEREARDIKSSLVNCKDALDDLATTSPVAICDDDFARIASILADPNIEDIISVPVRSTSGGRYTLIADHDNNFGWTIHLEDKNGFGRHILHNVEQLVKTAGVKWAGEDYV